MSCGKCETCGCAGNKEANDYENQIALTEKARVTLGAVGPDAFEEAKRQGFPGNRSEWEASLRNTKPAYESPIALTTTGRAIMEADITTPRGRPGEIDPTVFIQDDTGFLDADGKQIVTLSPIGRGLTEPVIHFAVPGDREKE